MTKILRTLKSLFTRRRFERDLRDEIESHLNMDALERIAAGESPEEAQRNARQDFGGTLRYAEDVRDSWSAAGIDRLAQDVRYALRLLRRNPGFAIAAVLTLGLGIGANAAIFSIVNAVLLKPLPYKNSGRLVRIVENVPASESFSGLPERTISMSPSAFLGWRSKTKTLSAMAMERAVSMTLIGRSEPVRLSGLEVSPALFSMLTAQPILGRTFADTEEKPGSDKVVVLSHNAWIHRFGADGKLLGRTITLDNTQYTVIGVMPPEFLYPDAQTSFWTPLALPLPNVLGLPVIARLKDNVPIEAAAQEAGEIARELRGEAPGDPQPSGPPRIQLMSVKDELVQPIRLPFLTFVIAVTFVLLVACVNVANLFLARATARRRELAIRVALGAGRRRVLRQLVTESFILASLGGLTGILLAFGGSRAFIAAGQSLARADLKRFELAGNAIPRLSEVTMDASVLLFTLALTALTGLLCGIIPALQIRGGTLIQFVNASVGYASTATLRFARSLMVIGQIGMTMVLLLAAGLLIKSFVKLANTNLGMDPTNVLTLKIPQPPLDYPRDRTKQKQQNEFAEEVVRRVASLEGVQAAAFTEKLPMAQGFFVWLGSEASRTKREGRIDLVSRDYFRVMGIHLFAGRGFAEDDRPNQRPVYVINRTAAREYFAQSNALGKTISGAGFPSGEIVGVVDDVRQAGLDAEPTPQLFMQPFHSDIVWGQGYYFVVRTNKAPAALVPVIRGIVHDLDSRVVVDNVATMDQIVSNSITTPRSYAVLLGTFSAAALVLALIGLYGLLAYLVRQRTREIGVRIALGAQKREILLLILKQGIALHMTGVALGIGGGIALTRYLQNMLFGVSTLDAGTFIEVSILFMAVALVAAYLPARQATATDPLTALRFE
jgi:putative ABC transport system permease protein